VTGGTGFLGYHLVKQLLDLGARVRVFALQPPLSHPILRLTQIEPIFGDILDAPLVSQALRRCEVVFHTAGLVSLWGPALRRMQAVHVDGTKHVLQSLPPDAMAVHTSSIVTIGASTTPMPFAEENPFNLERLKVDYVHAKRAAEQAALAAAGEGRRVVVVNPGYLVGPEDYEPSAMGKICRRFWRGRLPGAPPGGFNFVDVRDAAMGHLLAAEHGAAGRRYILGGENQTLQMFQAMLARAAGWRPRAMPRLPCWLLGTLAALATCRALLTGRPPHPSFQQVRLSRYFWYVHSGRAERELGYRPRSLMESLTDTYAWLRQQETPRLRAFNRWWLRPARAA